MHFLVVNLCLRNIYMVPVHIYSNNYVDMQLVNVIVSSQTLRKSMINLYNGRFHMQTAKPRFFFRKI